MACQAGHVAVVTLLLAHNSIDANKAMNDGTTPLFMVCQEGKTAVVTLLLDHDGIDANMAATCGVTPLFMASQHGHDAVVKLLLAHDGIDMNMATIDDGTTPLFIACRREHIAVVLLLLAHDAIDVNKATADTGGTPLHGTIDGDAPFAMQYLVLYGASLVAEDFEGFTPAQLATHENKAALAEWLNAVSGWSKLQVAAGCRLYKDAAFLLRRGKIDPDGSATTTVKDIMAVVAASRLKPAALPWQNAPPACRATIKPVADATRGWRRTTHWLHHKAVRDAVFAVLVVVGRLQTKGAPLVKASSDAGAAADPAAASAQVPLLSVEVWFFAMRFFKRSGGE